MNKNITITCLLGAIAVTLGAMGAHALKNSLSAAAMNSFETAVRYQLFHVFLLLFINTHSATSNSFRNKMTWLIVLGIFLFSGSIYGIYLLKIPVNFVWFITPIGGLLLTLSWLLTAFYFFKKKSNKL